MKFKKNRYKWFFYLSKKMIIKNLYVFILFIYSILYFLYYKWKDLTILTFNIIWSNCVWKAILLYYKINIFLNITILLC